MEKKFKGKVVTEEKILNRKQLLKQCYMVMQDVNHQLFCESVVEEVQLGMEEENGQLVSEVLGNLDLEELIMRCCTHILHLEKGRVQEFYELNQEGIDKLEHFFLSAYEGACI